jgi:hypothetical protein
LKEDETMNDVRHYSDFLRCLYDETKPHGRIGDGTHYSILRTATWLNAKGSSVESPRIHDFAVIWDVDHDERVICVIERMYMAGLLYPVLFVGERKGELTIVLSNAYANSVSAGKRDEYKAAVSNILGNIPTDGSIDTWGSNFGVFEEAGKVFPQHPDVPYYLCMLVQDDCQKVDTYLRNIHNLWNLGHKEYKVPPVVIPKPNTERKSLFSREGKSEPSVRRSIFPGSAASS